MMTEYTYDPETKQVVTREEYKLLQEQRERTSLKFKTPVNGFNVDTTYGPNGHMIVKDNRCRTYDAYSLRSGTGILDTLTTSYGAPTNNMKPDSLVTVGGMQMTLDIAERLGFVTKTAEGQYVEGGVDPADPPPAHEAPPEPQEVAPLSEQAVRYIDAIKTNMGPEQSEQLAHAAINSLGLEDRSPIERFAKDYGYDPEDVHGVVSTVQKHYTDQALRYLHAKTGEDPKEIIDWAQETFDVESLQQVMRLQVFGQNMAGYDSIIREWSKEKMKPRKR